MNSFLKFSFLITSTILYFNGLFAQEYALPEGFYPYLDFNDQEISELRDFDKDGKNDLTMVAAWGDPDSDDGIQVFIFVFLSKKWFSEGNYYWFPWNHDLVSMSISSNDILSIFGNDCAGRCSTELKFKYYEDLQNMKLIGYDEGHLPDYSGQGAYDLSVNLNTSMYQIGSIKKKVSIDLITLSNIELYLEELSGIGSEYK